MYWYLYGLGFLIFLIGLFIGLIKKKYSTA